jgi:hypothetical protein
VRSCPAINRAPKLTVFSFCNQNDTLLPGEQNMSDVPIDLLDRAEHSERVEANLSKPFLFSARVWALSIWALTIFSALVGVLVWHAFREPILASYDAKVVFLAATTLLWLPLILLLLDSQDNFSKGPRTALPVVSLLVLATLTALVAYDYSTDGSILSGPHGFSARVTLFAFMALAFIPGIWNASNFASYEAVRRKRLAAMNQADVGESEAGKNAEAMGALLATVAVAVIGALAFIAADGAGTFSVQQVYGLALGGAVIGIFAIVVLLDRIAELRGVQALSSWAHRVSQHTQGIAAFYNVIDTGLVRIGTHVLGMAHVRPLVRFSIQIATLSCLCVLAWLLPAPLGIVPALAGFILAVSVSRLWSWVEDDRALAAMTEYSRTAPYRVGFREDYRDETLVGFIFVFLLVPAAMMQAHNGQLFGPELFNNADGKSFADWFGFFGVELAKAVPIVDWAEIYGVRATDDMIAIHSPASMHAVFLARVMVDLLLIAGLLQALSIATRNRQQKQLYNAKHIDRLDPFVESTELRRAIRASQNGDGTIDLMVLRNGRLIDFRRYNEGRLRELYGSTSNTGTRALIEAIAKEKMRPDILINAIELTIQIAQGDRNEFDLVQAFQRALKEHDESPNKIEAQDLYLVLSELRNTSGLRDFKTRVAGRMRGLGEDDEAIGFLFGLAAGPKADAFRYGRDIAVAAIANVAQEMTDLLKLNALIQKVKALSAEEISPRPGAIRDAVHAIELRMTQLKR